MRSGILTMNGIAKRSRSELTDFLANQMQVKSKSVARVLLLSMVSAVVAACGGGSGGGDSGTSAPPSTVIDLSLIHI